MKFHIVLNIAKGVEVQEVLNDMGAAFCSTPGHGFLIDSQMLNYEITDSK